MIEIQEYDDHHVLRGPFAIANACDGDGLIALPGGATFAVRVSAAQVPSFFGRYAAEYFVGVDVAEVIRSLDRDAVAREFCSRVVRDGRLIDLRLLDRQINGHPKLRSWSEIVADGSRQASDDLTGHLSLVLTIFERLRGDATRIATEIGPSPPPTFDVEGRVPNLAVVTQFLEQLMGEAALSLPHADVPSLPTPAASLALDSERAQEHNGLFGQQVAIWAAVGIDEKHMPGFLIDERRLVPFRDRVDSEFQNSCLSLRSNNGSAECFSWFFDTIERDHSGFPSYHKNRLRDWLAKNSTHLCDTMSVKADMPRDDQGRPSSNPEHWGCWAACSRQFWAWRQVFRMAELARIGRKGLICTPRYEFMPLLRSLEPNLAAYRSLRMPIFRPRDRHVFVTGSVSHLPFHLMAELSLRRHYVPHTGSRLHDYILQTDGLINVIAQELREILAGQNGNLPFDDAEEWHRGTDSLFRTLMLGLPDSLSMQVMRNEYGIEMNEAMFTSLREAITDVIYELHAFREDATVDQLIAQSGLTAREAIPIFVRADDQSAEGRRLRNDAEKGRRSPVNKREFSRRDVAPTRGATRLPVGEFRGVSLGGRVTPVGVAATVRRHEMRLSAEDVMLAIASDLAAAGLPVLGIADEEFIVEVPRHKSPVQAVETALRNAISVRRVLGSARVEIYLHTSEEW